MNTVNLREYKCVVSVKTSTEILIPPFFMKENITYGLSLYVWGLTRNILYKVSKHAKLKQPAQTHEIWFKLLLENL